MFKVNKKFILLIILLLTFSILGGCENKPPEGVSQEFYKDMKSAIEELQNIIATSTNAEFQESAIILSDGFSKVVNYENKKDQLTAKEQRILDLITNMYIKCEVYYLNFEILKDNSITKEEIEECIETLSDLMKMKLDINKIIL